MLEQNFIYYLQLLCRLALFKSSFYLHKKNLDIYSNIKIQSGIGYSYSVVLSQVYVKTGSSLFTTFLKSENCYLLVLS
jgi:hypothetical protein